jgi:hypothetical protein
VSDHEPEVTTDETRDEGGVEVVGGREAVEPTHGLPTETKVFGSVGVFYLFLAILYAATAYEWSGVALLGFGAVFALLAAGYFWWSLRGVQYEVETDLESPAIPEHEGLYLPHQSVWPIGIGLGAAITLAGLAVGWWVLLPGAALLVHSLIGFAAQSRERT